MKTIGGAILFGLCIFATQENVFAQRTKAPQSLKSQTSTKQPEPKQETVPPMPVLPDIRNDPDVEAADVAIIANITMEELRFDAVPNPKVEFLGKDKTATVWHADRFNLPDKVEPGVTYRNVGIRLKITSRLADIDRIVAEALGEIPIKDSDNPATPPLVSPAAKPSRSAPAASPDLKKAGNRPPNE